MKRILGLILLCATLICGTIVFVSVQNNGGFGAVYSLSDRAPRFVVNTTSTVNQGLYPDTDLGAELGTTSLRFREAHIQSLFLTSCSGPGCASGGGNSPFVEYNQSGIIQPVTTTNATNFGSSTPFGGDSVVVSITATSSNSMPLALFASSSQAVDLMRIYNSNGAILFSVGVDGQIRTSSTLDVTGNVNLNSGFSQLGFTDCDQTTNKVQYDATTGVFGCGPVTSSFIGGSGGTSSPFISDNVTKIWPVTNTLSLVLGNDNLIVNNVLLNLVASSSQTIPLGIQASSSQTANLVQFYNSAKASAGLTYFDSISNPWFASSSVGNGGLTVSGALNASSSLFVRSNIFLNQTAASSSGNFSVDSAGNVSASGTLRLGDNLTIGQANTSKGEALTINSQADSVIQLIADTDNSDETHNPYIFMTQDNAAVMGLIGLIGNGATDPRNTAFTGTTENYLFVGGLGTLSGIDFGSNGSVRMTVNTNGLVEVTTNFHAGASSSVGGAFTSSGKLAGSSTLQVTGFSTLFGGLNSIASSSVGNDLTVSGDLLASSTLQATGLTTLYGGLISVVSSSFADGVQVSGALNASSSLFVSSTITLGGSAVSSTGRFHVDGSGNVFTSGTVSTTALFGAGLGDCDTAASSKLLWDNTTGRFSCGTDGGGVVPNDIAAIRAYSGWIGSNTGEFVVRQTTSTHAVKIGPGAQVANTMLTINASTSASGALVLNSTSTQGASLFQIRDGGNVNFYVNATGSMYAMGTSTINNFFEVKGRTANPTIIDTVFHNEEGENVKLLSPQKMAIQGNYAYVVSNISDSFEILDISETATATRHVGVLQDGVNANFLNGAYDVAVQGNYAYVVSADEDALVVIDITDPMKPKEVGNLRNSACTNANGRCSVPQLDNAQAIAVQGNYAYIAVLAGCTTFGAGCLEIVDISNPFAPAHVASIKASVSAGATNSLDACIAVSGKYVYLCTSGGVYLYDVSDPKNLDFGVAFVNNINFNIPGDVGNIYVRGNRLYVAGGNADMFYIVDLSDKVKPEVVGVLADGTDGALLNNVEDVVIAGDYAYLASFSSDALEILDISSSTNPKHFASVVSSTDASLFQVQTLAMSGNRLVTAAVGANTVQIYDIGGAEITNAEIGALKVGKLDVMQEAQFDSDLFIRDGLTIGNGGLLLGGDFGMYANTNTPHATNTLRFSHSAYFVASSTRPNPFIFDTSSTVPNHLSFFTVRNNGTNLFSVNSAGGFLSFASSSFLANVNISSNLTVSSTLMASTSMIQGSANFFRVGAIESATSSDDNLVQFGKVGVNGSRTVDFTDEGLTDYPAGEIPVVILTAEYNNDAVTLLTCNPHTISNTGMTVECVTIADDTTAVVNADATVRTVHYSLSGKAP